jgi:hypothetical protein
MQGYESLYGLLLVSEVFDKQHQLYTAIEKMCEGLPQLSLADYAQERISQCEIWYPGFQEMTPGIQLRGVLHNGSFALFVAQQKCMWRM